MEPALEIDAQYRALREGAGLLDRPDRRRIIVTGSEAAEFLQGQLTNDVEALEPGGGCYAALLDRKGKIRADMRVLRTAPDAFWIDTEPQSGDLILQHLGTYKVGRDADVVPGAADESLLSLIGPLTSKLLGGVPLGTENSHRDLLLAGAECRAVTTNLGADLIVPAPAGEKVREWLTSEGAEVVTEAAAEIVRVEAGRPRVGHEISPQTMPQEAGINERAVSFTKGCYVGQETVARLHYKGRPNRHLRLLRPSEPVSAGEIVSADGRELGTVGTAVISPAAGPLALAILRREAEPGSEVLIGDAATATVEAIDG